MPAEYRIDEQQRIVYSRAWGTLTDEDLVEHQRRLAEDPHFTPDLNQLYDFREVSGVELTSAAMHVLIKHDPFGPAAKRAFVVEAGALTMYGMMRMFAGLSNRSPDRMKVSFGDLEGAKAWLGLGKEG